MRFLYESVHVFLYGIIYMHISCACKCVCACVCVCVRVCACTYIVQLLVFKPIIIIS